MDSQFSDIVPRPRRGFDPGDNDLFTGAGLARMGEAQDDLQWLLDRSYAKPGALDLVSRHYQLDSRQTMALLRSTDPTSRYLARGDKQADPSELKDRQVLVDGLNQIILLEVALSRSPVFLGRDGVFRDLAGLRGTYRLIPQTDQAIDLILGQLDQGPVEFVHFFLDAPVSNSGRLKSRILERALHFKTPVTVELVSNADACLSGQDAIVSGDSVVLDSCHSWFNLARIIIENQIPAAWIIDLSGPAKT
ncbi:MAG: DUF434 domain-containing protein [Clostridia bacterium]|nr:DUF434 domain-containing protein [Clostridia bacterium]